MGPPKFGAPGNCPICPPPLKPALNTMNNHIITRIIVLTDHSNGWRFGHDFR